MQLWRELEGQFKLMCCKIETQLSKLSHLSNLSLVIATLSLTSCGTMAPCGAALSVLCAIFIAQQALNRYNLPCFTR